MLTDPKEFLIKAFQGIISNVKADALFKKYLHLFENTLYYRNTPLNIDLKGKLVLAGSGKASLDMGKALLGYLPGNVDKSLFISPIEVPEAPFTQILGDHPVPRANSLKAGKNMLELISSLNKEDTLIYLLSGGSSALMELPADGLTMTDLKVATEVFLSKGMNIHDINTLRAALSEVKAGKLASMCKARCYVFVLSDVMGNDMSTIGSGPFYRTNSNPVKIRSIVVKYDLKKHLSQNLLNALLSYEASETKEIPHYLIGSNMDLMQAAETACFDAAVKPLSFPESLFGEAQQNGKMIADMLKLYSGEKPACMIFGGETTVTLNDNPGLGGRAQELALSVLQELKDTPGIYLLSAGSDGMDGAGGAAGAIISAETHHKSQELGLSIEKYLEEHDSYHFHEQCDSLITTGYSGTNVGDVVLALIT